MDKKELIKILRSSSNDIKDVLKVQNDLKDELFENLRNLKNKDNSEIKTIEIIEIVWAIFITSNLIYSIVTRNNTILPYIFCESLSVIELWKIFSRKYGLKKFQSNYDLYKNKISHSENEISCSEYAIEFLNSITEDELDKYLSYKM